MIKSLESKSFIYIFIFLVSIYFLLSSGRFYSFDESTIYLTTRSIIESGGLALESVPQNNPPLQKGRGDKFYSYKGLAQSVLTIPYYLTAQFFEKIFSPRFVTMIAREKTGDERDFFSGDLKIFAMVQASAHISALVCCVFFLFLLRLGFSIKTSILSSLLLGVSTLVCSYSKFFYTQPLGSLFILIAVYFLFVERTKLYLAASGVFLGLSFLTRFEHAMLIPVFMFYIFIKENGWSFKIKKGVIEKIILFLLPIAGALMIKGGINYIKFGDFLQNGFPEAVPDLADGNIFSGLYGHIFSVGKSFFIFSPPLILAMFYADRFYHEHKTEALFSCSISACFILFYSKWINWHGGWCWGGRHLYAIIPFLLLPIGYFIEEMLTQKKKWQITVLGFFVLAGLFIQVLGMAPWMYDLVYDKDWTAIIYNDKGFDIYGDICVYTPRLSPILLHLKTLLAGKYIDFWFYHIYEGYGPGWLLFWAAIPLFGIGWSGRNIYRIIKSEQ